MRAKRFLIVAAMVISTAAIAFLIWARAAQRRAQSLNCASSVVSVCLAGRMWANDHGGHFPTNFISMSNNLWTPKVLCCIPERRVGTWPAFTPHNCTYEIVTPGVHEDATNMVFMRCTIHGHLGYTDMAVYDGVRRRKKFE